MKKTVIASLILLGLLITGVSFAQDEAGTQEGSTEKMEQMMKGPMKMKSSRSAYSGCKRGGCGGGMGMTNMIRAMQASSDGGAIILVGNKIIKYDKNLKKVNEVTVELPEQPSAMSGTCCGKGGCSQSEDTTAKESGE